MPIAYPKTLAGWTEFIGRQNLPILRHTAAKLARMRAFEDELDARSMADNLRGDPLMALRTFAQLAALRRRHAATDVSTMDRAILMMGITPFLAAFKDVPMVECGSNGDRGAYRGLLRVLRRAQHAQNYAVRIAIWRNDVAAEEIGLAALLHDLTEMLVWYCAPELAERIQCMLAADPRVRSTAAQRAVLGVTLNELQQQLAKRWHLPELLVKLMDDKHAGATRVRNAVLAVNVARHSALGWSNAALPDDFKDISELLSVSPSTARAIIRREALEAA